MIWPSVRRSHGGAALDQRQQLIEAVAALIVERPADGVIKVGIDGADGAGKTTFADVLATVIRARGRHVIRASIDRFHNPRAVRYRRGRESPEGYFQDSFNYDGLKQVLLDPLGATGSGRYRAAIFDYRVDRPVSAAEQQAPTGSILVFDGVFLHRTELRAYWDYSVFLDVGFEISVARCALRNGSSPDPSDAANRRYVEGQSLYLRTCEPSRHATIVIDNCDLAAPRIVRQRN
jgi:uridine kinase